MNKIKFKILISFVLLISAQKSFSQDLTGLYFTCEEIHSARKDTLIIDFRSQVFYLKERRYNKSYDTILSFEKTFQYSIDTLKCNEYFFTYNFKRSYVGHFGTAIHAYGQLQYHRKYKTLTFKYYKNNNKEVGRIYRYLIKKIEPGQKNTK